MEKEQRTGINACHLHGDGTRKEEGKGGGRAVKKTFHGRVGEREAMIKIIPLSPRKRRSHQK